MNSDYLKSFSNFVLHLFLLTCISALETTIFARISIIPHTDLWIIPIVYFSLHRGFRASLVFCFLSSLIVGAFTATTYSSIMLSSVFVCIAIHFVKNRSYVEGVPYFMMICLGAIVSFYLSFFISSWVLYEDPISSPKIFSWLISALISPIFAAPLRFSFWFIDTLTNIKQPVGFEVS